MKVGANTTVEGERRSSSDRRYQYAFARKAVRLWTGSRVQALPVLLLRPMAAFTPAITSSNRLEVVRLNPSISIFLIISNLLTHNRALIKLHKQRPALLRWNDRSLFTHHENAVLAEGAPVVRNGWNDRSLFTHHENATTAAD